MEEAHANEVDKEVDYEEEAIRLTTEGDGSDHYQADQAEEVVYSNIQEIIPGLFIGDYTAAIDGQLLKQKAIRCVVAASTLPLLEIGHQWSLIHYFQCVSDIACPR